ncbi:MAG: DHHA1 domain-containing protein [Dehalococcoidales bacterium]|nr:DHHA1 domain-containing protein [Dehalococcoidales bacterium]
MKTKRLDYDNPYARAFRARIVERRQLKGKVGVILAETLFYPTSGGQPHDTGILGGQPVLDVFEDGEAIVHVVPRDVTGDVAEGVIDWERRFDHMQQHTGQHILSQAFVEAANAETVSFHLSETTATIDVAATDLTAEQLAAVEDRANRIVFEDRPIISAFVAPERLAELPLRKPPTVTENIRIVEVAQFDWSPCGGTHCRAAGEVGLIKIRRTERRGTETRAEFACGWRALRDYRWKNDHVNRLANALSVRDGEAVDGALRWLEEAKAREKEVQALREELLGHEAASLRQAAPRRGGVAVVSQIFGNRAVDEVKHLAQKITAEEKTIALLAVTGQKGQLLFARSADVNCDMGATLRTVMSVVGGRGGGTATLAQGGVPDPGRVPEALAQALTHVDACLSDREPDVI